MLGCLFTSPGPNQIVVKMCDAERFPTRTYEGRLACLQNLVMDDRFEAAV